MNSFENTDSKNIEKIGRGSQAGWYSNGETKLLRAINPLRTRFIMERLTYPNPAILDVGCGGGILSVSLTKAGAQVTGLDVSEACIQFAKQHAQVERLKIDYRYESVEEFAERQTDMFDAVVCMEMLEHVPEPSQTVAACAKVLKAGGQIFFSTANRTLKAFVFAIIGGEYILGLLPRGTHSYSKFIRPQELKRWALAANLDFASSASLIYNPFTDTCKVARDKEDINYIMHFTKK